MLVLGPTQAFSTQEVASLQRYADRGGKLFMALDTDGVSDSSTGVTVGTFKEPAKEPSFPLPPCRRSAAPAKPAVSANAAPIKSSRPATSPAPSSSVPLVPPPPAVDVSSDVAFLNDLANIAGLKFSGDILANERQFVRVRFNDSDRARLVTNSFSSHASVSTLSRNSPRAAVMVFGAGSLDKAPGTTGAHRLCCARDVRHVLPTKTGISNRTRTSTKPGVSTSPRAVNKPITSPEAPKKEEKKDDKTKKEPKPEVKEMRAFVVSDADAFSDFVMGEVMGNQVMFVDSVRWLVGEESFMGRTNQRGRRQDRAHQTARSELVLRFDLRRSCTCARGGCLCKPAFASLSRRPRVKQPLIAHAVVLGISAALAFSVWSHVDDKKKPVMATSVEVWGGTPDALESIAFESTKRSVKIEPKKDGTGRWFVVDVEKDDPVSRPHQPDEPPGPNDKDKKDEEDEPTETKHESSRFVSVKSTEDVAQKVVPLVALRAVGRIEGTREEEFGLDKPEGTLTVKVAARNTP